MSVIEEPALLERDAELASLEELIARGDGDGLLVIEGSAGIGKTRLLAEARARAEARGMEVLWARGSELEHEFGYGVVRQLFERLVRGMHDEERAELLGGAAAPAASVLAPVAPVSEPGGDSSFATLHGLYWTTANLAERRPLMLVIDDLHWCDPPSLRWLSYLVRRIEGLRLLVAVALRPTEPGSDAALLAHVTHDPHATVLRPATLTPEATTRLVRTELSADAHPAFCGACHDESGGNPLLLGQLIGAVAAEGLPPSASEVGRLRRLGANAIERVVALRFARLPGSAAALARAVAIVGDGVELRLAACLAQIGEADAHAAAVSLGHVEILRRELPLAFVHPMVRESVRAQTPPVERATGHARAARLLAEWGAAVDAVAAQLLHAPPAGDPWVVARLREAARGAPARGAADSAGTYLRRALAEPPSAQDRVALLLELARAETLVDGPAALAHLQEAYALAEGPELRARIAVSLGESLYLMARADDAMEVLERALEQLDDGAAGLRRELAVGRLWIALTKPSLYPLGLELLAAFDDEPVSADLTGRMLLACKAYHEAYVCGRRDHVVTLAREALAGGLLLERDDGGGMCASVTFALLAADEAEAGRLLDASIAEAHKRGSVLGFAAAKVFGSRLALLRGELRDAEDQALEGMEACADWGIAIGPVLGVAHLAAALMEQGRLTEAEEALARAPGPGRPPFTVETSWLLESRARLLVLQGDLHGGLSQLLEFGRDFGRLGGRNPAFHPWRSDAALVLLSLGEQARAGRLAAEELELARAWGAPRALGRALRVAGLAEGGDAGLALLREAADVLEPSPARLEHAKALVELGAALRRANRRADAREPLRRGLELATICGAAPLADRAATELLATGARLGRIALSGVEALTPSERRAADLAASGASNREIAQTLFVTVKTVEVHLSSAYRKLDIASRAQLADALARA
jgi:DNA-binding CsgD family transcriptional regulator/tetratricopeptide (TPR) repeat protein